MKHDPALDIAAVYAGYGAGDVINDITLSVLPGETYGLVGLNGAGKTTLIKTILGLKDASRGEIAVSGAKAGTDAAKSQIAYLPERFDPAWFLNAYEFIAFTLSLYGRKLEKAQADEMAEQLGLKKEYLSKRAQSYSKGMRQKLGLMATFMTGSPLMILDEPMSGLDPLARAQVKKVLVDAKAKGRTVFLSSHILADLEELCDRIAVLHGGRIMFIGKPSDLLKQTGEPYLERAFLALAGLDQTKAA
ncbi:MAG: ABC transporter ATP-binding protein [Micavibrio aeruginosavorus]|uniref:ABC transporter ATP-binding protein n=1 Tax=Micavibrio aeruginosavorus TaxID=349221 RepID=A0A2W5MTK4_9BACT|nr:MAG: ABC transporter ATP-binding protein [Micavibrio aeruginosavorus]